MTVVAVLSFLLEPDTIASLREAGVAVSTLEIVLGGLILNEVTKLLNRKDITQ